MAEPVKRKTKKHLAKSNKAIITKVRRKSRGVGVSVKDLVGTIKLTVDPIDYQRSIRDEWE